MAFWRRKKKEPEETPVTPDNRIEQAERVLLWIDERYNDLASRLVRHIALAEAFKRAGIPEVILACRKRRKLPSDLERRGIRWFDTNPESGAMDLNSIAAQTSPQLILAESPEPIRPDAFQNVVLCSIIDDSFSEEFFEDKFTDTIVLPGWIDPPDFDALDILPSRLADCVHGNQFICLPDIYENPVEEETEEDCVLIVLGGYIPLDTITKIIEATKSVWEGTISLLADVNPSDVQPILDRFESSAEIVTECSTKKRYNTIHRAKAVITPPTLSLYEFIAAGKPLLLVLGAEQDIQFCQKIEKITSARTVVFEDSTDWELLKSCLRDFLGNDTLRQELKEKASQAFPRGGADRLVKILLERFHERARRE